uniref:Uncharacterized protein n=1 Tax=Romanomermis culicivorax TaxID=13658 RepID=A0A915IV97_ROMCU
MIITFLRSREISQLLLPVNKKSFNRFTIQPRMFNAATKSKVPCTKKQCLKNDGHDEHCSQYSYKTELEMGINCYRWEFETHIKKPPGI